MEKEFDLSEKRRHHEYDELSYSEEDVREFIKRVKEKDGIQQIQNNIEKSFKGTFRDAMKNGYNLDKHYVIVDWVFFHELLEKRDIDKLAGKLTEK